MKSLYCLGLAAMAVPLTVLAQKLPDTEPSPAFTFSFEGSFNYAPVSGFLQTPAGGEPGTSTVRKPELKNLGIDDVIFPDFELGVQWRSLKFYGGAQLIRMNEEGTLNESFISRDEDFLAGESFKTKNRMDWFRLGVGWRFDLFHNRVTIMPSVEAAILDFNYDLKSVSSAVSRSYTQGTARLGLNARYQFNRYLSFELEGNGSLPIDNMLHIYGVAGTVHISLAPATRWLRPDLFLGVGWQRIDYEDSQTLPNHIRTDFEPYMTTGLTLRF